MKLDDSCTSNPKSEIADWTVQFEVSDFGFEVQESSNFKFVLNGCVKYVNAAEDGERGSQPIAPLGTTPLVRRQTSGICR